MSQSFPFCKHVGGWNRQLSVRARQTLLQEGDGIRVDVMPTTWNPGVSEKKPVAILYLTTEDLRELLKIAEDDQP